MPNIRCKEKTKEELEQQLLKEYASYLSELLMRKEVIAEPLRSNKVPPAWRYYNWEGFSFGADFVF